MGKTTLDELIKEREVNNNNNSLERFLRERNLIVTENSKRSLSDDQILNTADICSLLKCDRHLVYQLAESKQLLGFKKKGWKFTVQAFRDYISQEMNSNN
ncbi:MAG TPA: hypothetical protein DGG95_07305 [Cytophagales bacterium]|jgi:hypothetical protein|nr:hypothetical protein [Cytophagales bacterium]